MFDSDQGPVESQDVKHLSRVPNLQVYRTDKDLDFFLPIILENSFGSVTVDYMSDFSKCEVQDVS